MSRTHCLPFNRMAVLASGAVLLLGGVAPVQTVRAQTVSVFDDAPSIEQLRTIMVPKSRPGSSRSIVIQRADIAPSSPAVQRVSTEEPAAARPAPARARQVAAPRVREVAASAEAKPGAVAFHVNFAFNSAVMPDSAHDMMAVIARLMKESPEIRVRVEGHTDAVGSPDYNITLSERRALSVGEYLVKQGVEPSRLELVGKGLAEPLTSNKYDAANRRVQFVRIG